MNAFTTSVLHHMLSNPAEVRETVRCWLRQERDPERRSIAFAGELSSDFKAMAGAAKDQLARDWLMLATAAFWLVRIEEVQELFQGLYRAGQYPVGIYPGWLRTTLTFFVPVAFAVTIPAESLTGRLEAGTALGTLALAGLFFAAARWFWRFALRHYTGASA